MPDMQEQMLEALRRGAIDEALALARAAVDAQPDSARAQRMLATALGEAGDRDAALVAIDRALSLAPEDPDTHFQRGLLLVGVRQPDAARAALDRSIALNPNQLGAYILQAQLALGRGQLDEAERLARLAARIDPAHPWVQAVEGMAALAHNRPDEAIALLTQAVARAPDDPQVLLALALAYGAKGHDAFAEQALRKLVSAHDGPLAWRILLAEALQRQGRPGEAMDALRPSLTEDALLAAAALRLAGELELAAGRPREALAWLRRAIAAEPRDARTLAAAIAAWRQLDDRDDARAVLDAALATSPDIAALWQARLRVDADDAEAAAAIVARWSGALPEDLAAMDARMRVAMQAGDHDGALALAQGLVARVPGHQAAHALIVELLHRRDPAAAIAHVADLLAIAATDAAREPLMAWLALLEDSAGRHADAVARWESLGALRTPNRLPLPPVSLPPAEVTAGAWPAWSARGDDAAPLETLFLWGAPGSCVENVAAMLSGVPGFRADRLSPQAPGDVFQRFASVPGLSSGELDPAQAAREWREGLVARGIDGQHVIEWLVWWDNALLRVLRTQVERAGVLFAVRDPRDMLLQWAAFGAPAQIGMPSLQQAAWWLALTLTHMAEMTEEGLYRATVLKLDGIESDAPALTSLLSDALGMPLSAGGRTLARGHFPSGHWRRYADVLAGPFAQLAPVARRLGYPES